MDCLIASLQQLTQELRIETFRATAGVPTNAPLYFIDYSLDETPEKSGEGASGLLQKIVEAVTASGKPPAVFLMSRNRPERTRWQSVADNGGFLRFCFRYVDKPDLSSSPQHCWFQVDELLESLPLGRAYFSQVNKFNAALAKAAAQARKDLFQLTPADFREFAARKLKDKDGSQSARHLRHLFVRLLEAELESNPDVDEALQGFGLILSRTQLRMRSDVDEGMLYRLQSKILYDRSATVLKSPIMFGDVFWQRYEGRYRYFLCITPECDLEVRSNGRPKAESLLLVEGIAVDTPLEHGYLDHTPLVLMDESNKTRWFQ